MPSSNAWSETLQGSPWQGPIVPRRPRAPLGGLALAGSPSGPLVWRTRYQNAAAGVYRVKDDALIGYLLYRGVDAFPDLTDPAWETFTSLPHQTASLDPDHVYHFVLRARNAWGLITQNVRPWVLRVAADGSRDPVPPSAPTDITVVAWEAGAVRLTARYNYLADGILAADTWLIYLTTDGVDPDPGLDTPVEVMMVLADGVARLTYTAGPYALGATVKVLVRTRRSGTPDVDSVNEAIVSAVTTAQGPAAPSPAGAFVGTQAEQSQ